MKSIQYHNFKMISKRDNRAAGDTIPPLPKVNSLQALMRLRPKRGAEWGVLAFSLNRDMIQPDGTLDDLHGVVFSLGSFDDVEKAEAHAKSVIEITGHPAVIPVRYGYPLRLTPKFDPEAVRDVPVDMKGKLIQLESAQYKREQEEFENRIKQEREMMQEAAEETNPDSIEHFKRQCFLAIKNRSKFQMHSKEADTAWADYKKRESSVREHYARHPEHETQWLKYLKTKLKERGELPLYYAMREAYRELRDELLGLVESSEDESLKVDSESSLLDTMQDESNTKVILEPSSKDSSSEDLCPNGVCFTTSCETIQIDDSSEEDIMSSSELANQSEPASIEDDGAKSPIPFSDEEIIA